jgi:dipeptide transport system permease protein
VSEVANPQTLARTQEASKTGAGKPRSPLAEFWFYFRENRGAVIGLWVVCAIIFMAVFADVIVPHNPDWQYRGQELTPPVWQEGGTWTFPLGTDPTGRDMLSRLVKGAQYSLLIGIIVVTVSITLGVALGLTAAFAPRIVATAVLRAMDVILAFPSLLLALVMVAVIGPSLRNAMIAIAITYLPHFVRLARASAITELRKDYVTASRVAGASIWRLMFVTVLTNCVAPLIVQATLSFSTAVLDAAALGFLGMGAQPPTPEWGTMLADSREFITRAWWVVTFPGIMILVSVLAFNLAGDGLRDALDPKLKRS